MEWIYLLLALLLPLCLGAACTGLLIPAASPGRAPLVWGNGMLLGLLVTPLLLRLLDALGAPPTFAAGAPVLGALILLAVVARRLRPVTPVTGRVSPPGFLMMPRPSQALFLFLLALVVLRILTVGLEVLWRPLFPWDATMHWATKARVWFEAGSLVPFVENQRWLELGGEGVFTDHHPGYPVTIPLLQLWVNSALGRWDESLMNLPWLLCFMGLGAAFYGQARAAGSAALPAMAFTYFLLSMPLLNTHVALAGYADLFLGACYCAAIMSFYNWSVSKDAGQGALALAFALMCPLIKNEGFYWLLTFLPALLVVLAPLRVALLLLVSGSLVLVAALVLIPADLTVAGHSLKQLDLTFRPRALAGIATALWVQDNWHLLGYLLPGLSCLALALRRPGAGKVAGIAVALTSAIVLLLVLFLFTKYSLGAVRFTAVNRISLHIVPALVFLALTLYRDTCQGESRPIKVAL